MNMNTIYIILYVLCALVLFLTIYLMKKKIDRVENKTYFIMMCAGIISFVLEIVSLFIVFRTNDPDLKLFSIINRSLYISFIAWLYLFSIYYIIASLPEEKKDVLGKKIFRYSLILLLAIDIIFVTLDFQIVYRDNIYVPVDSGPAFIYSIVVISAFISLTLILLNIKRFKDKKFWPLLFIFIFFLITLIVEDNYLDLLIVNVGAILVTFVMSLTIDNPDVRIITQLSQDRDQANRANSAKTDFLSNMSHEIRTPLNAIVGFSNALAETPGLSTEALEDIDNIIKSSATLLEIVNGILDISKIEANKLDILPAPYKFEDLFDQLVSMTQARLGDKPLDFRYTYDKKIPEYLYGDIIRVKQISINLLTNAVKYTHSGYVDFKINCIVKKDRVRLIIIVEDSGIGVKTENYNKLFNKFERIEEDGNNEIEGTGLGLAITKRLVELMNGSIVVRSTYGKGSTFTLALDQKYVLQSDIDKLKKEEEEKKSDTQVLSIAGKNLLIIDDNMMNLKVAQRLLKQYNLNLKLLSSGQDCINEINNGNKYDLIFIDDLMPGMSGGEALIKLKAIPNFKTPVVVLTANAISGVKEEYMKQGFDDYLSKPIEKDELERVLKKYLNNK